MSIKSGLGWLRSLAMAWAALFWLSCVGIPIVALLSRLGSADFLDPAVLRLVRFTLAQAGLSTLLSAAIGLPLGLAAGRKGKLTEALLAVPFAVPAVVAAVSWVLVLGRNGLLSPLMPFMKDWCYSLRAVILAHVFFNAPWIALVVSQSRRRLPAGRLEAARTLGASSWDCFRWVEWPAIQWAFLTAMSQAFSFCVMSFALVLILGGGPPVETLETAVYSHLRLGVLDLNGAIVCAAWELVITLLPWAAVLFFQARARAADPGSRRIRERGFGTAKRPGAFTLFIAVLFILPYFITLSGRGWRQISISEWAQVIGPAAGISFKLAFASGFCVVSTALAAVLSLARAYAARPARTAFFAGVLSFSSGMSALVLGLGFWLAFGRWVDPFEGSALAIVAIQTALFFNLAFRLLWPLATERKSGLMEAAMTLGASPVRAFFEVEWRRWRPAVFSAFAVVAAASFGEVAAVSLFYSEKLVPLPLLIARWSAQYRFDEAQSVAALLFLLAAGTILIVVRQDA
jgi:thiamine transport system permease protein